ncbi:putative enzyme related to lactoylglutathione lyase [Stackebrandtia albiflava]|uniref:Putative enzyme related to lactoylglutathione lyase n=1 Tax=Stackebrandtia albiflava TaxID=406432 RepID=A0A562V267_9ACTN|nr:VOC family protein [Stackebrandtia albiflava]TWJ11923.1 putative enzyme related to lactoylglutathione lyase [Stackebrandtia albiflava]
MALKRMDNIEIIVEDLDAVIAFFTGLGMELEGTARVEGAWAARLVGLDDQTVDIAMLKTPDGSGRVELARYVSPEPVRSLPVNAPPHTLGIRRIMFAVDDIDETIDRMRDLGAELVGEVVQFEDVHRLCYLRGPEGILVALAEDLR